MIVSPPIKSTGTQEASPDVSGPRSIFKSKTGRKGTSGLFVKLLAGLTKDLASRKAEKSGFGDPEKAGDTMFFNGETAAPAGKKGDLLFRRRGAAEEGIPAAAFPAVFRPEAAIGEVSPEQGTEKTAPQAENALIGRFSGKQPAKGNRRTGERPEEKPDGVPMGTGFPSVPEGLSGAERGSGSVETPGVDRRGAADAEPAVSGGVPDVPKAAAGEWPVPGREFGSPVPSAPPGPEPAEKGRRPGAGAKAGERRKEKPHLEVRDFRTPGGQEEGAGKAPEGETILRKAAAAGETELVVELRGGGRDMFSAENFRELRGSPSTQSFESLLARELNQSLSGDIVRHAQAVLRDGNEGTIKLTLRPETLGNVKIRLEMAENKISGHIIVESEEALKAFEREISSLEQAFRNAGFEAADLEMSLNQGGESERRREREDAGSLLSAGLIASRYAHEQEVASEDRGIYVSGGQITVNMLI
ncbi:MAG: flagellar hook-length control protein FliK [Treponema sp.]|nr:flagellar hook-length control protein FliK [Treponema sp.]